MTVLRQIGRHGERWLMLWLYTFIALVIVIEVIRRFGFDYSSLWGEEAARYAFVYLVWIAAAVGVRNRAHIRFDAILHLLSPRAEAVLSGFGNLMIILFACFAFYWSVEPVLTSIRFGSVAEGLRISRAWFVIAVPLGFLLVITHGIAALIEDLSALRAGRRPPSGEKLFE